MHIFRVNHRSYQPHYLSNMHIFRANDRLCQPHHLSITFYNSTSGELKAMVT